MNQKTFKPVTRLAEVMEELKQDGMIEINRIFKNDDGDWVFEYTVK